MTWLLVGGVVAAVTGAVLGILGIFKKQAKKALWAATALLTALLLFGHYIKQVTAEPTHAALMAPT